MMKRLDEKLAEIQLDVEMNISEEQVKIMNKSVELIFESKYEDKMLKVGDKAPSFNLLNQSGQWVSSKKLLRKGPVAIVFYFGTWCPYCNADLSYLKSIVGLLNDLNATLLGVSPQSVKNNYTIHNVQKLNYDLLYDANSSLSDAFGVSWELDDDLKDLYKELGINLPEQNNDERWVLPLSCKYVIDMDGFITYVDYKYDYRTRSEPEYLFDAVRASF